MKRFLTLIVLTASLIQITCNDNKNSIKSVILQFSYFKSPSTSFTLDFNSNILTGRILDKKTDEPPAIYKKDYKLTAESRNKFRDLFTKYMPDTPTYHAEGAIDGGGFEISYVHTTKDTTKLTVRNPDRDNMFFKTDFLQIDEFFKVAYTIVTDSMGIEILDKTYENYVLGLPIRKLSDHPLTYKIWGDLSGCRDDNKELLDFLNDLAKKQCVIVQVGERKLSYCLTEVIAEYSLKPNIHFISDHDLPWLWKELNNLKKQIHVTKRQDKGSEETNNNGVLLDVYLSDSAILNKWLDIPMHELFKTQHEIKQNCH